jgi:hypothetical protein
VFRREEGADGAELYSVIGLWGNGNVVTDRRNLYDGTNSGWSMWDGHALFGPARPGAIEKFPALVSVLDLDTFLARYAGVECELWNGEEELGIGCEEACAALVGVCPEREPRDCVRDCRKLPRMVVECIGEARGCADEERCGGPPPDAESTREP